ncbi:putative protein isoform X1 [Capsicum annuum]
MSQFGARRRSWWRSCYGLLRRWHLVVVLMKLFICRLHLHMWLGLLFMLNRDFRGLLLRFQHWSPGRKGCWNEELDPELWGLPPFVDCMLLSSMLTLCSSLASPASMIQLLLFNDCRGCHALLIEPVSFRGLYKNGLLHHVADVGPSTLPDQIFGFYFG